MTVNHQINFGNELNLNIHTQNIDRLLRSVKIIIKIDSSSEHRLSHLNILCEIGREEYDKFYFFLIW